MFILWKGNVISIKFSAVADMEIDILKISDIVPGEKWKHALSVLY